MLNNNIVRTIPNHFFSSDYTLYYKIHILCSNSSDKYKIVIHREQLQAQTGRRFLFHMMWLLSSAAFLVQLVKRFALTGAGVVYCAGHRSGYRKALNITLHR